MGPGQPASPLTTGGATRESLPIRPTCAYPARRVSPAQQLVEGLLVRRAEGIPFEFAWNVSLDEVRWPTDPAEHSQWRQALIWARAEFEDAYQNPEGVPAFVERTLALAPEGLDARGLARLAVAGGERVSLLGAHVHA